MEPDVEVEQRPVVTGERQDTDDMEEWCVSSEKDQVENFMSHTYVEERKSKNVQNR
jgi:hypothetical protein